MKNIYLLGLFAVVFTSACVIPGLPGGGGEKILTSDILTIENVNVIPKTSVSAGEQFTISFEVKSQVPADQPINVNNVKVQLFDYGLCKPMLDPSEWTNDGGIYSHTFGVFVPQQTEFVEWNFEAPTNEQIARLSTNCPIRFKISYDFNATTTIDADVISATRLNELQRSGQTPTFTPTQTVGSGPLKIMFSYGTSLPVRTTNKTSFNSTLPLLIQVEDQGTGLYPQIPPNSLTVNFNKDFEIYSCDRFNIGDGVIKNSDTIQMIKKKSVQLRCLFLTPDESVVPIEKTYVFTGNLFYSYDVTKDLTIDIKPTLTG